MYSVREIEGSEITIRYLVSTTGKMTLPVIKLLLLFVWGGVVGEKEKLRDLFWYVLSFKYQLVCLENCSSG